MKIPDYINITEKDNSLTIKELELEINYLKGKIEILEKIVFNSDKLKFIDKEYMPILDNKNIVNKDELTYKELIKLVPKDKCFYIEVESNPEGKGSRQKLLAFLSEDEKSLNTYFTEPNQININGIDYTGDWKNNYKGKYKLIEE